jgi:hypothetical protein
LWQEVSRDAASVIRALECFIPPQVLRKLVSAPTVLPPCDVRPHVVLQIKIFGLSFLDSHIVDKIQMGFLSIQRIVIKNEGTVWSLKSDDKTLLLTALFGAEGFSHDDDCVRALKTALSVKKELNNFGLRASIGISSGFIFVGFLFFFFFLAQCSFSLFPRECLLIDLRQL